jgi:hypothetical protein
LTIVVACVDHLHDVHCGSQNIPSVGASIGTAVLLIDGLDVNAIIPKPEHVIGPPWSRPLDGRAAILSGPEELVQRPCDPAPEDPDHAILGDGVKFNNVVLHQGAMIDPDHL